MTENTKKYLVTRVVLGLVGVLALTAVVQSFLPSLVKEFIPSITDSTQLKLVSEFKSLVVLILVLSLPYAGFSAIRKFDLKVIYATDKIVAKKLGLRFWGLFTAIVAICGLISPPFIFFAPIFGLLYYSYNDYKNNHKYFN